MDDEFVQDRYEQEVRGERNARISDTDKYVQLPDITVQSAARSKRAQLTESDRQALLDYRQALKDLPDQQGFPFVDYPEFPEALAYELEQAVNARNSMRQGGFFHA